MKINEKYAFYLGFTCFGSSGEALKQGNEYFDEVLRLW